MDESTAEQWAVIGVETAQNQGRVAERVLGMLRSLSEITDGFATDQLTHCCQTATRAERDGADDEVVVASLCHDIGKAISVPGHPQIAAAILQPYVRPEVHKMILVHQDFQGAHYYHHFGGDPNAREKHRDDAHRRGVEAGRAVRRRLGPEGLRPRLRHPSPRALRGARAPGVRGRPGSSQQGRASTSVSSTSATPSSTLLRSARRRERRMGVAHGDPPAGPGDDGDVVVIVAVGDTAAAGRRPAGGASSVPGRTSASSSSAAVADDARRDAVRRQPSSANADGRLARRGGRRRSSR